MESADAQADGPSDEALIAALRQGDREAADELTRRYWHAIQRYCRNYLRDEQLAEDVTQETFSKLTLPDARLPEGAPKPWLYKTARNHCLDILRRRQRSPTRGPGMRTGVDYTASLTGARTRLSRAERRELIREIILEMPEDYRGVLMLRYFESLQREEIAEALGVSVQAVKGRLVRATQHLHDELRRLTTGFTKDGS